MGILNIDSESEILPLGEIGVFQPLQTTNIDGFRAPLLRRFRKETEWSVSNLKRHVYSIYKQVYADVDIEAIKIIDMPWLLDPEWGSLLPRHQLFILPLNCKISGDSTLRTLIFVYVGEKINIDESNLVEHGDFWANGLTEDFIKSWYRRNYMPRTDEQMYQYFGYFDSPKHKLQERTLQFIKENKVLW